MFERNKYIFLTNIYKSLVFLNIDIEFSKSVFKEIIKRAEKIEGI